MKWSLLGVLLTTVALAGFTRTAQAGAMRFAGKEVDRASTAVAHTVASGGSTAADGVRAAGKATGEGVATGASATERGSVILAKGVQAVPGKTVYGTVRVTKGIWKAIW